MKKIIRMVFGIIDAFFDIAQNKPTPCPISIYGAREKFEAGAISVREYNEIFEHKEY